MPLKLNIGLSRKIGEPNYGSRGASVNVELEVDSSLVTEPTKLQERIRQLFGLVRTSLAEELNGNGHHAPAPNGLPATAPGAPPSSPPAHESSTPTSTTRRATQSQVKAIYAIARNQAIALNQFLADRFGTHRPDELTIQEASQAIDALKNHRPA